MPANDSVLVSVVIPARNSTEFLPACLESVANQNLASLEVIIVDDGSTDGTSDRAKQSLTKLNLKGQVYYASGKGAEAARDIAIQQACGTFIAPLDSDDIWNAGYLSRMLEAAESNPDCSMFFSDFWLWDEASGDLLKKSASVQWFQDFLKTKLSTHVRIESKDLFSLLLNGQLLFPSCTIYRRSLFNCIGPYSKSLNLPVSTDWEFALRASRATDTIYINEPLLKKRIHFGNVSGDENITAASDVTVCEFVCKHYELSEQERAHIIKRTANRSRTVGQLCLENGDFQKARKYFIKAWKNGGRFKDLLYILTTYMGKFSFSILRIIYKAIKQAAVKTSKK